MLRVFSAKQDLTGQRELGWVADDGQVGRGGALHADGPDAAVVVEVVVRPTAPGGARSNGGAAAAVGQDGERTPYRG
jgi:hypothetical protein